MAGSTQALLARWRHAAGLDFHVLVTLLFRGWSVLAGAAMLIFLPLWLSPVQLGYYYTFASILALQIFFELGMNQVVTQMTSHEVAHLEMGAEGSLTGDAYRIDRLTSLVRMLRRWYLTAGLLFFAVVGLSGTVFFLRHDDLSPQKWLGPWIALVMAASLNLYLSPSLALIEGTGRVGEVARLRLYQSMAGYGLAVAALACGMGLWASSMIAAASAIGSGVWLLRHGPVLRWLRRRPANALARVEWKTEIFPFQWRIALSWISGYFIFQLFVPMVFVNQGAAQAGRFGMVLAVFNALQSIGMSWVNSKSPQMAKYVSLGDRGALKELFLRVMKPSVAFTTGSSAAVVLGAWLSSQLGFSFVRRLSSVEVMCCIALVTVINSVIFGMAVFMRTHKEEPMTLPSVVLAVIVLCIARWASAVSVEATAALYLLVTLVIALPWTLSIFKNFWRRA